MHAIMSSFKVMFHDHKVLLNQNHENNIIIGIIV